MGDELKNWSPSQVDLKIQIRSIKDTSCFRIRFSFPVFLLFHLSTSHLREVHGYYKYQDSTFPAGFLPAYNCNLNHLTMLKTFKKTFSWFTNSLKEESEDYFCKKFLNDRGERMEQSSLNFILQNNSRAQDASADETDKIYRCFEYFCWHLPVRTTRYNNSTIHNFIYHSSRRIYSFHQVYKTFARILHVDRKRYDFGDPRWGFKFVYGKATMMFQDGEKMYERIGDLIIAEPDASRLKEGDLINCIVDRSITKPPIMPPPWLITGIVGQPIQNFDLKSLISIAIWKHAQKLDGTSKFCEVCSEMELKALVKNIIISNHEIFYGMISNFEVNFRNSLIALHPFIILQDGMVYHIPPPLMAYILSKKLTLFGNKNELGKFLCFVDLIKPRPENDLLMVLRTSKLGNELQSGSCRDKWDSIVRELPSVANRIIYSRIFSQPSSSFF